MSLFSKNKGDILTVSGEFSLSLKGFFRGMSFNRKYYLDEIVCLVDQNWF